MPDDHELTNRHYAVVVDGERARVVAVRRNGGWVLPTWESAGLVRWNDAGPVNDALRSLFDLDAVTLRPLLARRDGAVGTWAHELEPRDAAWEPGADAHWVEPSHVSDAVEGELVESVFAFARGRPPWARAAWYGEVETWIDARLEELGRSRSGPARQVHAWAISSVLRVPTDAGDVYFKAVPPLFGSEPALTAELGRRHPGRVTSTLAVDLERRWLLMDDLGGTELAEVSDPFDWEEALRRYAELQLAWVGDAHRLLELGCRDRGLDVLAAEIEPTLADPLLTERPPGLSAEEQTRLPALSARLTEAVGRLRALEIPPTLEHGDLHSGNVRVRPGGPSSTTGPTAASRSRSSASCPFSRATRSAETGSATRTSSRGRHCCRATECARPMSSRRSSVAFTWPSATAGSRTRPAHTSAGSSAPHFRSSSEASSVRGLLR